MEDVDPQDVSSLADVLRSMQTKRMGIIEDVDDKMGNVSEMNELKENLRGLKVVSRAKVTQDRIYSAAYHPEVTKDLIFFGGASVSRSSVAPLFQQ